MADTLKKIKELQYLKKLVDQVDGASDEVDAPCDWEGVPQNGEMFQDYYTNYNQGVALYTRQLWSLIGCSFGAALLCTVGTYLGGKWSYGGNAIYQNEEVQLKDEHEAPRQTEAVIPSIFATNLIK